MSEGVVRISEYLLW